MTAFYGDLLNHNVLMDQGCITTLTDAPWGVRRFFVSDPVGRAITIMTHV